MFTQEVRIHILGHTCLYIKIIKIIFSHSVSCFKFQFLIICFFNHLLPKLALKFQAQEILLFQPPEYLQKCATILDCFHFLEDQKFCISMKLMFSVIFPFCCLYFLVISKTISQCKYLKVYFLWGSPRLAFTYRSSVHLS